MVVLELVRFLVLPQVRVLMLQVQVRVLETMLVVLVPALVALVLVPLARVQALVLQVLTGGDSGNLRGLMKPMRKCGMQTVRRWLRWKLARTGRVALTLRILTLSVVM